MKRLLEEPQLGLEALTALVASAEPQQPDPFSKRRVKGQVARALLGASARSRAAWRPYLLGGGVLFVAATAAAAGYSLLVGTKPTQPSAVVGPPAPATATATAPSVTARRTAPELAPTASARVEAPLAEMPLAKRVDKPRPGEDPTQVAEAVRALRKQGDAVRAQRLLDEYLRGNPRGALAEDALALSIEAAAARRDPRAAEYAKRYLARYPNGRFKSVAERALSR